MKEARHLVSHLRLTAPRRIKHSVTIWQAEFLGMSYWRLQQQDPLLLVAHLLEKLKKRKKKFLHWNFRYQRKHSMSKCLPGKINQGKTSSYWHPVRWGTVLWAGMFGQDARGRFSPGVTSGFILPAGGRGGRWAGLPQFMTHYLYHLKHISLPDPLSESKVGLSIFERFSGVLERGSWEPYCKWFTSVFFGRVNVLTYSALGEDPLKTPDNRFCLKKHRD